MSTTTLRGQEFKIDIDVTASGNITNVSASSSYPDENVSITTSLSSVVVEGIYLNLWEDNFTYVSAGESNKTEDPSVAIFKTNLPPDKNLYNVDQDLDDTKEFTYKINITYDDAETLEEITEVKTFTHIVQQDLEVIRDLVDKYNYNNKKGAK